MTGTAYQSISAGINSMVCAISGSILAYDVIHFIKLIRARIAEKNAVNDVTAKAEKLKACTERRRLQAKRVVIATLFLTAVVTSAILLSAARATAVILAGIVAIFLNNDLSELLFRA